MRMKKRGGEVGELRMRTSADGTKLFLSLKVLVLMDSSLLLDRRRSIIYAKDGILWPASTPHYPRDTGHAGMGECI